MKLALKKKKREPNRSGRPNTSISVSWATYDKLDALARKERVSLGAIVEGLIKHYEEPQQ